MSKISLETRDQQIAYLLTRIRALSAVFCRGWQGADREDASQDALLFALERLGEYDPARGTVQVYLNSLARSAFRQICRARQMERSRNGSGVGSLVEGESILGETAENGAMSREEQAILRQDLAALRSKLSEKEQAVFDLLGSHTHWEIASVLHLSRAQVSRIVRSIQVKLEPYRELFF